MKKTYLRDNPDGSPYFNYDFTDGTLDITTHAVVLTGPITGPITLSDGTTYNVTDFAVPVKLEHVDELLAAIETAHEVAGTFADSTPSPTVPNTIL